MPGDGVEPEESPAAAKRELKEETGVSVEVERPISVVKRTSATSGESVTMHFVTFAARAVADRDQSSVTGDDEAIEDARWFCSIPEDTRDRSVIVDFLSDSDSA